MTNKAFSVYVDGDVLSESLYSVTETGFTLVAPLIELFPCKKANESGEYDFDIQVVYSYESEA